MQSHPSNTPHALTASPEQVAAQLPSQNLLILLCTIPKTPDILLDLIYPDERLSSLTWPVPGVSRDKPRALNLPP